MSDTTDTVVAQGVLPSLKGQTETNEHLKGIQTALEDIAKSQAIANSETLDPYVLACIDGTATGFKRAMKLYFQLHKVVNTAADDGTVTYPTAAAITACATNFYNLLQSSFSWDGGTKFSDPAVSSVSTGTKFGDNTKLTCTPSTADVAGQDDYAGLPLFACIDCNWIINQDTLDVQITAIEGVTGNFKRYDKDVYVGVLQMTGYHYYTNPDENLSQEYIEGYRIGYSSAKPHCQPLPESVRLDGTVRPWVVHGKYAAGVNTAGGYSCCSGAVPARDVSHDSTHTSAALNGKGYAGECSTDNSFLQLMTHVIFGSLTLDGILNGCYSYYAECENLVAETNTHRLLTKASDYDIFVIGSVLKLHNQTGSDSHDSVCQGTSSISGKDGYVITNIEKVTINNTEYTAIYFDETFTTSVRTSPDTQKGATVGYTYYWRTGSCDNVLGNTGSVNPTDAKHSCKLQGIEFGWGQWQIVADTILNGYQDSGDTTNYYWTPYICKNATKYSTAITSDYKATDIKYLGTESWQYIKANKYSDGIYYPDSVGASSSTFTRDAIYTNKATGLRALFRSGYLYSGLPICGLSCAACGDGLGNSWWNRGSRLSAAGCRGEWTA